MNTKTNITFKNIYLISKMLTPIITVLGITASMIGFMNLIIYSTIEKIPLPTPNIKHYFYFIMITFTTLIIIGIIIAIFLTPISFRKSIDRQEPHIFFSENKKISFLNHLLACGIPFAMFFTPILLLLLKINIFPHMLQNPYKYLSCALCILLTIFVFFYIKDHKFITKRVALDIIKYNLQLYAWMFLMLLIPIRLFQNIPYDQILTIISFISFAIFLFVSSWIFSIKHPVKKITECVIIIIFICSFTLGAIYDNFLFIPYKVTKETLKILQLGGHSKVILYLDPVMAETDLKSIIEKTNKKTVKTKELTNIFSMDDTYYVKDKNDKIYSIEKKYVIKATTL